MLALIALFITAENIMLPLWSEYTDTIGGDLRTAGTAVAVYCTAYAFSLVLAGYLANKYRCFKAIIFISFISTAIGYQLYKSINSPMQLYCLEILLAIATSFYEPAFSSYYSSLAEKSNKSPLIWTAFSLVFAISEGFGAFMGSYVAHYYGFYAVFNTMSALTVCAAGISLFAIKSSSPV